MALREWFHPPRHVLTIFLGLAVLSAGALGWLTWLLLEQAADRATAVMQSALADLELQLNSNAARTSEAPPGIVFVISDPAGIVVRPDAGLLYYPDPWPEPGPVPESPTAPLVEAEQAEFARRGLEAAANLYSALAAGGDAAVRARGLAGLARVHRKARNAEAALAAYDELGELAELSVVRVAGLPPGLVARTGRARVLEETGQTAELRDEAATLAREIASGRWQLTKSQYQFYSAEARRWLGEPEPATDPVDLNLEAVALADAVLWLWNERPWEAGPSPTGLAAPGSDGGDAGPCHLECYFRRSQAWGGRSERPGFARPRRASRS